MKPPVDAPTSRQSRPVGSTPNASSACASFSPPRETNRGGRSTVELARPRRPAARACRSRGRARRARAPAPARGSPRARARRAGRRAASSPSTRVSPVRADRSAVRTIVEELRARAGRQVRLLPRAVPETLIDEERSRAIPAVLGRALAERARPRPAEHVADVPCRRDSVVELGCGLGLPSLVAAPAARTCSTVDWAPDGDLSARERNALGTAQRLPSSRAVRGRAPALVGARGRSISCSRPTSSTRRRRRAPGRARRPRGTPA